MPRGQRALDRPKAACHHAAMDIGRPTSADPSAVSSRDDFAAFLGEVFADYRSAGHDEWENNTLERFLNALSAFAGARVIDQPDGQEAATLQLVADMIVAATSYE